jgi:hypothetical protein
LYEHTDKDFVEHDGGGTNVSYQYNILPRFVRVREIKIVEHFLNSLATNEEDNDGIIRDASPMLCLVCSCGYFKRFGITCRHVYAVLAPQSDHAADPPSTDDAIVLWRKDYLHYHSRDENLTALYDTARETEAPGTCARKEHIDFLWPHHNGNCILFQQQFLSQHNQNRKSAILKGTKWNPRQPLSRRNDFNNIGAEEEDSGLALSRNSRLTSMMTVASQEDESSELLLLGGCSQEICITASVNVGIAPAADHDDGQNDKSLEEEPGAADDSGDDRCWDNQQQQPEGRHLQNDGLLGKHVYSSNLSLYTQVANFAEGNAGMARELRGGLESMLSKFIVQKNSKTGKTGNTSEHEFASLPHVDSSRRNKRLRPALSPEKQRFKGQKKKYQQ